MFDYEGFVIINSLFHNVRVIYLFITMENDNFHQVLPIEYKYKLFGEGGINLQFPNLLFNIYLLS